MSFSQNISLKKYSNFNIGGPASYFSEFRTKEELKEALKDWKKMDEPGNVFVLGGGTNVLFNDGGFEGLVLRNNISFIKREMDIVEVGGGTDMEDLVNFCTQNSLSGFEWAGGLPGTVGGGIRGNAGAFLGDMSQNVLEIESLDIDTLKSSKRKKDECGFGYRQSIFKKSGTEIILSAKFGLKKGNREEIKQKTQEKIDYRIDRHPLDLPNIGSTFKNVPVKNVSSKVLEEFKDKIKPDPFPVIPTAKLLVGANLKGKMVGGAMISQKHPNFIVNFNRAKAEDVLGLISLAKKEVKKKYGVELEEEIMFV